MPVRGRAQPVAGQRDTMEVLNVNAERKPYTPSTRAHWQISGASCGDDCVQCRGVPGCNRSRASKACPFTGNIGIDVTAAGPRQKRRTVKVQAVML